MPPTNSNPSLAPVPRDASRHLAKLFSATQQARKVCVLLYGNPDPDALASGWALKTILEIESRAVEIRYTGTVGRPENAAMIRQLRIPVAPASREEIDNADMIAVVDAQPQFFEQPALPRCDIVIDHHPDLLAREVAFADIRPGYAATSSIMAEYLAAAGIKVFKRLASALYYGIFVDSRHFIADMSSGDIKATKWLSSIADRDIVQKIEFSQFSREALDYFSIALVRRRLVRGVMFSHLGPVPVADVCVQVADFFIRVENVEWALVTGVVGQTLIIVFRNDGLNKDAGHLAAAAFNQLGSAGGHKSMGRAEINQQSLPDGLLLTDNKGIERFVLDSLSRVDPLFGSVLKAVQTK